MVEGTIYALGQRARDKVTGWEGVLTGRATYLYGCTQYVITATELDKDGKLRDGEWFDEGRIELLSEKQGIDPASVRGAKNGGPNRDTPSARR